MSGSWWSSWHSLSLSSKERFFLHDSRRVCSLISFQEAAIIFDTVSMTTPFTKSIGTGSQVHKFLKDLPLILAFNRLQNSLINRLNEGSDIGREELGLP